MPLELRLRRIEMRLAEAFASAPPLSRAEYESMRRLQACFGAAAATGVGDGCMQEREAARANGLFARDARGAARYAIPDRIAGAAALPLGAARAHEILIALETSNAAETALSAAATPHLDLIQADLAQALVCDAEDAARGRRRGPRYDPGAPIPDGP